jgi:hypothetical protein
MGSFNALRRPNRCRRGDACGPGDPKPPYPLNGHVEKAGNSVEKDTGKGCPVYCVNSGLVAKSSSKCIYLQLLKRFSKCIFYLPPDTKFLYFFAWLALRPFAGGE